jgi:hypothetical protein
MRRILIGVASAVTLAGAASLVVAQQAPPEKDKGPAAQDRGQRQPGPAPHPGATDIPKRSDQPKSTEPPERGRSKTGQPPDRDSPRGADRPDRERPKATERPDRDRPKATERPDQERPKATERPDKERPKATERPDQERQKSALPEGGKDQQGRLRVSEKERSDAGVRLRQTQVEKTRVNINVNVGSTVPRTVRLRPLPVAIFAVAPVYRGYSYVVLEDETIVIVDARTYVVVDVIPAGTRRVERPGPLALSTDQMHFIYTRVPRGRTADVRIRLALGAEVPRNVELLRFPGDVVERVPEIRPYRYIVVADDVVIVDPTDNAVVLVISE